MHLWRRLHRPEGQPDVGCVAAIGAFDGLHRGHRVLIDRAITLAGEQGLSSLVITFEPLPREYLFPADPPARLTSFRERWRLLEDDGPDGLCVLRFGAALRALSAEQFVERLSAAGVRTLVIGHDFRAGRGGAATAQWFQEHGPRHGMHVEVIDPVAVGDRRASSSAVREALHRGDLDHARTLLGRPYSMRGRVIAGERLGRQLGFPTANLRLQRRRSPLNGIFAIRVRGVGNGFAEDASLAGVASLGTRPTVGGVQWLLEAHVFDFTGDLYGREIEVEFIAHLRDEMKFASVDALVEQMHRDAAQARAVLEGRMRSG
jgi:riboflavin kinase/FMN adenylyltransferase